MSWYPRNPNIPQNVQTDAALAIPQGFLGKYSIVPGADGTNNVLPATSMASGPKDITGTVIVQPDVPRNLAVKSSNNSDAGVVVVHGQDMNNDVLTENATLNGTTAVTLAKAFKSITRFAIPADQAGSLLVGAGGVFGLPNKMSHNSVLRVTFDGTVQSTPTVAVSTTSLANNTVAQSGGNGTKVLNVHLIDWAE